MVAGISRPVPIIGGITVSPTLVSEFVTKKLLTAHRQRTLNRIPEITFQQQPVFISSSSRIGQPAIPPRRIGFDIEITIDSSKSAVTVSSSALSSAELMLPAPQQDEMTNSWDSSQFLSEYQDPLPLTWLLTILYVVVLATVIVANVVTFSYYFLNRSTGMLTNCYVVSLAIADFLWPLFNVPLSIVQLWTPSFVFGSVVCRIAPVLQMIFPEVISATLCIIAVERYYSVLHPFDDNPLLKRRIVTLLICLTWLVPVVANAWLAFAFELVPIDEAGELTLCVPQNSHLTMFPSASGLKSFMVVQAAVVIVLLPGFLMPICYGHIIFSVSKSETGLVSSAAVDFNRRLAFEHRKRVVTFVSLLVQLIHFSCWVPIIVFQLLHAITDYPHLTHGDLICYKVFTLMASANAAFNSLVYTAVLKNNTTSGIGRAGLRTASNASTFALIAVLANRTRAVAVQIVKYRDSSSPPTISQTPPTNNYSSDSDGLALPANATNGGAMRSSPTVTTAQILSVTATTLSNDSIYCSSTSPPAKKKSVSYQAIND